MIISVVIFPSALGGIVTSTSSAAATFPLGAVARAAAIDDRELLTVTSTAGISSNEIILLNATLIASPGLVVDLSTTPSNLGLLPFLV